MPPTHSKMDQAQHNDEVVDEKIKKMISVIAPCVALTVCSGSMMFSARERKINNFLINIYCLFCLFCFVLFCFVSLLLFVPWGIMMS